MIDSRKHSIPWIVLCIVIKGAENIPQPVGNFIVIPSNLHQLLPNIFPHNQWFVVPEQSLDLCD